MVGLAEAELGGRVADDVLFLELEKFKKGAIGPADREGLVDQHEHEGGVLIDAEELGFVAGEGLLGEDAGGDVGGDAGEAAGGGAEGGDGEVALHLVAVMFERDGLAGGDDFAVGFDPEGLGVGHDFEGTVADGVGGGVAGEAFEGGVDGEEAVVGRLAVGVEDHLLEGEAIDHLVE